MKYQDTEFFVGLGTLALINAGLAQSKNRSGFLWFFISLLLGPVATLLIVVLRKVEPSASEISRKKEFDLEDYRQQ